MRLGTQDGRARGLADVNQRGFRNGESGESDPGERARRIPERDWCDLQSRAACFDDRDRGLACLLDQNDKMGGLGGGKAMGDFAVKARPVARGACGQRRVMRPVQRDDNLAGCDACVELPGKRRAFQHLNQEHGVQERRGRQHAPQFAVEGDERRVGLLETVEGAGDGERQPSEVDQLAPVILRGPGFGQRPSLRMIGQDPMRGIRHLRCINHVDTLFSRAHDVFSRGIPRTRSEMMLRWISLVPPAMVHM